MYGILADGKGEQPKITEESFTGYNKAKKRLEDYLRDTDRVGFADYPSKPRDKVRQRVQNATSERE